MDYNLVEKIYSSYQESGGKLSKEQLFLRMKESENWKRQSRRNHTSGFTREYYSDSLGGRNSKVKLLVHSPKSDNCADSYVFTVDNTPIAGGKTQLKSVFISTKVKDKPQSESYIKLSPEELRKVEMDLLYGDGFKSLETERVI